MALYKLYISVSLYIYLYFYILCRPQFCAWWMTRMVCWIVGVARPLAALEANLAIRNTNMNNNVYCCKANPWRICVHSATADGGEGNESKIKTAAVVVILSLCAQILSIRKSNTTNKCRLSGKVGVWIYGTKLVSIEPPWWAVRVNGFIWGPISSVATSRSMWHYLVNILQQLCFSVAVWFLGKVTNDYCCHVPGNA